jgi:hypothetical protein
MTLQRLQKLHESRPNRPQRQTKSRRLLNLIRPTDREEPYHVRVLRKLVKDRDALNRFERNYLSRRHRYDYSTLGRDLYKAVEAYYRPEDENADQAGLDGQGERLQAIAAKLLKQETQ